MMSKVRSASRGYTTIEVLSAMTLLAIGAAGVIGMQRVTLQGSEDARRFDMGTNIANEWCTRLQRDSTSWTAPNDSFPNTININTTQWLQFTGGPCATNFCDPPTPGSLPGNSGSFDVFGRDMAPGGATYCAQYRLAWVQPPSPTLNPPFFPSAMLRAEVRVFWSRLERNPIGTCASATPNAADAPTRYHFVYATTMVRENTLR